MNRLGFILLGIFIVVLMGLGISFFFFPQEGMAATEQVSWLSVLPPLMAILLALVTKQVIVSLFISIWLGAFLMSDMSFVNIGTSFFSTITDYMTPAIADVDHVSIMLFSVLIGGIIGVISENGGTRGIVELITRFVKNRRQGMVVTTLLGFIVFFDDYANTMVVGNTMRPITDKLKITRAKLAYLVDSTSAPVATIALVSTWIGAMVAYIADAEKGIPGFNESAYLVFLNSLSYNFYSFMTIFFVLVIAFTGKDYGAMLTARVRLLKGQSDHTLDKYNLWKNTIEKEQTNEPTSHFLFALIPIIVLVVATLIGLFISGEGNTIQDIIGSADSYSALLWGSLASLGVAIALTLSFNLLDIERTMKGMTKGMHTMFDGLIILVMAWSLSALTKEMKTADFLVTIFDGNIAPHWIPVLIFVLSGLTSFSTGSSWGTMGILMPIVLPLTWTIGQSGGLEVAVIHELIYASVASVLAGSVFGDHCSPISDTTILSSISSQCDHIEHVQTQLPYALTVGFVAIFSLIAVNVFQWPIWLMYVIFIPTLYFVIQKFGNRANDVNFDDYTFVDGSLSLKEKQD